MKKECENYVYRWKWNMTNKTKGRWYRFKKYKEGEE